MTGRRTPDKRKKGSLCGRAGRTGKERAIRAFGHDAYLDHCAARAAERGEDFFDWRTATPAEKRARAKEWCERTGREWIDHEERKRRRRAKRLELDAEEREAIEAHCETPGLAKTLNGGFRCKHATVARVLLAAHSLSRRTQTLWASVETISRESGVGTTAVKRCLADLADAGVLVKVAQGGVDADGGRYATRYVFDYDRLRDVLGIARRRPELPRPAKAATTFGAALARCWRAMRRASLTRPGPPKAPEALTARRWRTPRVGWEKHASAQNDGALSGGASQKRPLIAKAIPSNNAQRAADGPPERAGRSEGPSLWERKDRGSMALKKAMESARRALFGEKGAEVTDYGASWRSSDIAASVPG